MLSVLKDKKKHRKIIGYGKCENIKSGFPVAKLFWSYSIQLGIRKVNRSMHDFECGKGNPNWDYDLQLCCSFLKTNYFKEFL